MELTKIVDKLRECLRMSERIHHYKIFLKKPNCPCFTTKKLHADFWSNLEKCLLKTEALVLLATEYLSKALDCACFTQSCHVLEKIYKLVQPLIRALASHSIYYQMDRLMFVENNFFEDYIISCHLEAAVLTHELCTVLQNCNSHTALLVEFNCCDCPMQE